MNCPIAAASFRDLRQAANFRAAAARHDAREPGARGAHAAPGVGRPTGGVKKPASRAQIGHREAAGRKQRSDRRTSGRAGAARLGHSSIALQTYRKRCRIPMLDTPRPCDMLANSQKGPKIREVVSLPVPSFQRGAAWFRSAPVTAHRHSAGSRPGSPSMGLSDDTLEFQGHGRSRELQRRGAGEPLRASRAPRDRILRALRVSAEASMRPGSPPHEDTARALQSMSSSKRSTWRWGLVNEETA